MSETALSERLDRCFWCHRRDCPASEWEQEHHAHGWQRLCRRCAGTRLRNPYNALLSMRKVTDPGACSCGDTQAHIQHL